MAVININDSLNIDALNALYRSLSPRQRIEKFYKEFRSRKVLFTSSFGAHSVILLNLISKIYPQQNVTFIDTGNHFIETLNYRGYLIKKLGLRTDILTASKEIHKQATNRQLWLHDPKQCCHLKKVEPISKIKGDYDFWLSGLMEWQSDHRSSLNIFEERNGIVKFYPLLDVSESQCNVLMKTSDLPAHPLVEKGYQSIGCTHCTEPAEKRNGRWRDHDVNECGLHS